MSELVFDTAQEMCDYLEKSCVGKAVEFWTRLSNGKIILTNNLPDKEEVSDE